MPIYKAILKYGYKQFKLEIFEYCDIDVILVREQYYIDLLKPEYNILNIAGSSFGYKHTPETLDKFKSRIFSKETLANLSKAAKGRVLPEEVRVKISDARTGIKLSDETKAKLFLITSKRVGISVLITNITCGETKEYANLTRAARALNVSRTAIKKSMDSGSILKKTYLIKLSHISNKK